MADDFENRGIDEKWKNPDRSIGDLYQELKAKNPADLSDGEKDFIQNFEMIGATVDVLSKAKIKDFAPIAFKAWDVLLNASMLAAPLVSELAREYLESTGKKLTLSDIDPIVFESVQNWLKNSPPEIAETLPGIAPESLRRDVIKAFRKRFKISRKNWRDLSTLIPGDPLFVASTIDAQTTLIMIENIIADPWKPWKKQKKNADHLADLRKAEITRGITFETQTGKFKDGREMKQIARFDSRNKNGIKSIVNRVTDAAIFYSSSGGLAWKFFIVGLAKVQKIFDVKNNKLLQPEISFSARELRDLGMYESNKGALNGIGIGIEALRAIEVYVATPGIDPKKPDWHFIPLFIDRGVLNGGTVLTAKINPSFPWKSYLKQYTYFPPYIVELTDRAARLLGHILLTARQRGAEIKKNGFFIVRLSTVKYWLQIPDPASTKNPKQDIKDPIISAINEITIHEKSGDMVVEILGSDGETLDPGMKVQKWLDSGVLKITIKESGGIGLTLEKTYSKGQNKKMRAIRIAKSRKNSRKKTDGNSTDKK